MPQIARLRFDSVGHPNARLDGLILDFRDRDGQPTDTAVWLENGGGKSSMLNLFFSVVQPSARQFLGSKSGEKIRTLENYVGPEDRAVIAVEWQMDASGGGGETLFGEHPRVVTGVFIERGSAGEEEGKLKKLFFSFRVTPQVPQLTLEGLPLHIESASGERSRWTMAGIKNQLSELRTRMPVAQVYFNDAQREWSENLDALGIDTELFSYQIQMNLREGGAADLFQFRSAAEFVDFFLKMVQDENMGEGVARTIGTYREQLKNRQESMIPECDLVEGMIGRFRNLVGVADRRGAISERLARVGASLRALRTWASDQAAEFRSKADARQAQADDDRRASEKHAQQAQQIAFRWVAVFDLYTRREFEAAEWTQAEAREMLARLNRLTSLWKAATPLSRALRERKKAESYAEQLRTIREASAPLLARVQAAARAYAAAVEFRMARTRSEALALGEHAALLDEEADAHRGEAARHDARRIEAESHAREARGYLERMKRDRARLVEQNDLTAEESPTDARKRWQDVEERAAEEHREAGAQLEGLRENETEIALLLKRSEEAHRKAEQEQRAQREAIERADALRRPLEEDEMLLEVLQVHAVPLDDLDDGALHLVEQAGEEIQAETYRLWSQRLEAERILHQLDHTQLLPPSREVDDILRALRPHVQVVVSGWEYIEKTFSSEGTARRDFVDRKPHLAAGVIVRDADFEAACRAVREAKLELDAPVVLAPQSAAHADEHLSAGIVVGPTHNAHFHPVAAVEECARRGGRLESVKRTLGAYEERLSRLRTLAFRLRDFRAQYPRGWFAQARVRVEAAEDWARQCGDRAASVAESLETLRETIEQVRRRQERLHVMVLDAERRRFRIDTHLGQYPASAEERREALGRWETAAREAAEQRDRARELAVESARLASARRQNAGALEQEKGSLQEKRSRIEYAAGQPISPQEGDLPALASAYESLRGQYAREVGANALEQSHRDARTREQEEMAAFRRALPKEAREEDVLELLRGVEDLDRVEEMRSEAEKKHRDALSASGNAAQAVNRAKELVEKAETEKRKVGVHNLPHVALGENGVPFEPAEVEAWLAEEDQGVGNEVWLRDGLLAQAEEGAHKAELLRLQGQAYADKAEQMDALRESYGGLSSHINEAEEPELAWHPPSNEVALSNRIAEVRRELLTAQEENQRLDQERNARVGDLIEWMEDERFERVVAKHAMIRHIRNRSPEAFERDAADILENLVTRLARLQDALAGIDQHRETLIEQALAAAERGIHLLQAAERQSRLPGTMPRFGGRNFLKVSLPDVEPMARRTRMAGLIDEVTSAVGDMPSGEKLLQMAVRRLAEPVKVSVLFPDPGRRIEYIPVERLGAESGGEKLTSAILLYCTLVQMRARQRGTVASRTSTLLLDNPFGTASRVSFLEVQIETARAAGVQLVYTTGVKDYDAIATFPNINRLRPAGYDPVKGEFLLERVDAETGVAMARLVRTSEETLEAEVST